MNPSGIDIWLDILRAKVLSRQPDLIDMFDTYAGEAKFGRAYIEPNLQALEGGSSILEIGAGALMLSAQLVREGFKVTALEPTGEGFSHFDRLRELVMEEATASGCAPELLGIPAEELAIKDTFAFAFSINVMEHVGDIKAVIHRVCESLNATGTYRFTCPNYLFPYEAHFNIPTFFSKDLTEKFFMQAIRSRTDIQDPVGLWRSLNWITVGKIRNVAFQKNNLKVYFGRKLFAKVIERVVTDPIFANRRSLWMRWIFRLIVNWNLHNSAMLIPLSFQPVIDCSLTRSDNLECTR